MKLGERQLYRLVAIAREITKENDRQFKHTSFILNKKLNIIAIGTNKTKTHTAMYHMGYPVEKLHSEVDAYTKLSYTQKRKKIILINFRFGKEQELRLSKPCKYCLPWCLAVFDEIYYSTETGFEKINYDL